MLEENFSDKILADLNKLWSQNKTKAEDKKKYSSLIFIISDILIDYF